MLRSCGGFVGRDGADARFREELVGAASHARADEEGESPMIENGKTVFIEYTLKLDDGTTADTNVGGEPLIFEQGTRQILPALEAELMGLKVDDTKQVKLSPEDGYGPVDPEAFREVETDSVPEDAREVGMLLLAQDPMGNRRPVRVHELSDEPIVLALNHPLAGQSVNFDIRVVGIE